MEDEKSIRVVIADDHVMVREGLRQLLGMQPDITVVGEANDGVEALEMTRSVRPDVLLLDIAMPRLGGLEAAKLVSECVRETKIVILSMFQAGTYAHHARDAGARGYIMKGAPSADLLAAIRTVHEGGVSFPAPTVS